MREAATWTLAWQRGPMTVAVPHDNVQTIIVRPELPSLGSPADLVRQAVLAPIGCPPLPELARSAKTVALLVTDVHDSLVGAEGGVGMMLLDLLNASGVPDSRVTLVHAAGMHGHYGAKQRLGGELLARVRYSEHDPTNEAELAFLGATLAGTPVWVNRAVADADLVIGVGGANPSLFGFQGGAGIILPGVSGRDTIRHNHTKIMCSRVIAGWGPGNPVREDILDAGALARLAMKVDFAANKVFAGAPRAEWPRAVAHVEAQVMTPTPPADIYVLAPPHGRPQPGAVTMGLPGAIYMGLEFATQATRPGGIIIVVASAAGRKPLADRPVEQTLAETIYITEQWIRETGDDSEAPDPATARERRAYWRERDMRCKEELLRLDLPDLSRILTRRQGEARTTTMCWSHRNCLTQRRTFLVSEGVSAGEGERMGFALVTDSFERALDQAFAELGRDASVAVSAAGGYPLVAANRVAA